MSFQKYSFVQLLSQILLNIEIIAPIFLLVILGYGLKLAGIIDEPFIAKSSKFIFMVSLPAFLFNKVSATDFSVAFNYQIIVFAIAVTLAQFLIAWLFSYQLKLSPMDKGVFVQGSCRSNFAIIGLAILLNVYDTGTVSRASIVLAFVMPLYNLLSVIVLTLSHKKNLSLDLQEFSKDILLNPLVISIIVALPFSYRIVSMPNIATSAISYLASIALPLALVNIGASVNLTNLKSASKNALIASSFKIIIFPAIFTLIGFLVGFRNKDLGILFVLFGSPTAIVSFIMAEAMNGNRKLAGNIIVISTLASIITMSIGLGLLQYFMD